MLNYGKLGTGNGNGRKAGGQWGKVKIPQGCEALLLTPPEPQRQFEHPAEVPSSTGSTLFSFTFCVTLETFQADGLVWWDNNAVKKFNLLKVRQESIHLCWL